MERSGTDIDVGEYSAVQNVQQEFGIPVVAIANLKDLLEFLNSSADQNLQTHLPAVQAYREKYGV